MRFVARKSLIAAALVACASSAWAQDTLKIAFIDPLTGPPGQAGQLLLVEQKLTIALKVSHRLYVMGHGEIVFEGTPTELQSNHAIRKEWLEI
jgi:hypothetical protein